MLFTHILETLYLPHHQIHSHFGADFILTLGTIRDFGVGTTFAERRHEAQTGAALGGGIPVANPVQDFQDFFLGTVGIDAGDKLCRFPHTLLHHGNAPFGISGGELDFLQKLCLPFDRQLIKIFSQQHFEEHGDIHRQHAALKQFSGYKFRRVPTHFGIFQIQTGRLGEIAV